MATCFWVGGSATWDNNNTGGGGSGGIKWASASGGGTAAGGAGTGGCPGAGDSVTFDASSGGGTVTVASSAGGIAFGTLTAGAFTGTIDWSVNNPSQSFSVFSITGTGARKFLLGTGTLTITGVGFCFDLGTTTNLDALSVFNGGTINFNSNTASVRRFSGGGKTYGAFVVSSNPSSGSVEIFGSSTFSSITLAAGTTLGLTNGTTTTVSAGSLGTGTSANPILIDSTDNSAQATISCSGAVTLSFGGLRGVTTAGGGTFTATSSFDFGRNTGWTISAPSGGGAVGVIGG